MRISALDDRTFEDLAREGLRIVGSADAEWTNHNPSDPGITFLELLAYTAESLIYRVGQITDEDLHAFARLLDPDGAPAADVRERLAHAVRASRRRERLVSCEDYELAGAAVVPALIARAHCVPDRDLTAATAAERQAERPGHLSLLLVPRHGDGDLREACDEVLRALRPRALLTTRLHVGVPEFVDVAVRARIGLTHGAPAAATLAAAHEALDRYLDPATGGPDGRGWPPGRWVYVSEVLGLVDRLPGVDHVARAREHDDAAQDELVVRDAGALVRDPRNGDLIAVRLEPHQMVRTRPSGHELLLAGHGAATRGHW